MTPVRINVDGAGYTAISSIKCADCAFWNTAACTQVKAIHSCGVRAVAWITLDELVKRKLKGLV